MFAFAFATGSGQVLLGKVIEDGDALLRRKLQYALGSGICSAVSVLILRGGALAFLGSHRTCEQETLVWSFDAGVGRCSFNDVDWFGRNLADGKINVDSWCFKFAYAAD